MKIISTCPDFQLSKNTSGVTEQCYNSQMWLAHEWFIKHFFGQEWNISDNQKEGLIMLFMTSYIISHCLWLEKCWKKQNKLHCH